MLLHRSSARSQLSAPVRVCDGGRHGDLLGRHGRAGPAADTVAISHSGRRLTVGSSNGCGG